MNLDNLIEKLPSEALVPITTTQSAIDLYMYSPELSSFGIVTVNIAINEERTKRTLEPLAWHEELFNEIFSKDIS